MDALSTWLQGLGLERYTAVFAESDVDLEALCLLTDAELEKLGVSLRHRKKLLKAIAALGANEKRAAVCASVSSTPPPDRRRYIRGPLALATLLLIATLCTDVSWAQTKILRVGILSPGWGEQPNVAMPTWIAPFYRTLREHGWVDGDNVVIVHRDSAGDPTRMPEVVADLMRQKVDVLFPVGRAATRAAVAAAREIPIVAHDLDTDPLAMGYAKSYSHPGGNLTGVFLDAPEVAGKWLELLKSIVPGLSRVVVLWDPTEGSVHVDAVRKAARELGVRAQFMEINTPEDIDKAPSVFRGHPQAMIILPSPMMWFQSARLAQLAKKTTDYRPHRCSFPSRTPVECWSMALTWLRHLNSAPSS